MEGKVQMVLNVTWDVDNIFEYMVAENDELRTSRDRTYQDGAQPTQDQMIALGQFFEAVLETERARHRETVEKLVSRVCAEVKVGETVIRQGNRIPQVNS